MSNGAAVLSMNDTQRGQLALLDTEARGLSIRIYTWKQYRREPRTVSAAP
jgi:hypothetical protein